jgi:small subunit ribosomal protein S27Ae
MPEEVVEVKEKKKKEYHGKRPHINKPTSEKWKMYKIEGEKIVREKSCPRCGPGVFLMKAKDRIYCGKCHFTEFGTASSTSIVKVAAKEIKPEAKPTKKK